MDCFLCTLLRENPKFREKREEIKNFSKEILLSCKQFLKARKHHKHKYNDVVLPDSWDDEIIGYHSSCYKEFRVKAKYLSYESTGKKKLYLDINEIHAKLGEQLSRSLAICHIFTGNDYNPAFYRKGKKRPFDILKKNTKFQEAFIQLHSGRAELTTSSEVFRVLEEYVCRLYTLKTKSDVNKGRYELFEKSYKCNNQDETIVKKKIVGYDPSVLPPTKQELLQQIKRTSYISSIWCNAHMRSPTEKSPENCGWALMDDKYYHYWFDGPHSPSLGELSSDVQESDDISSHDCDEDEDDLQGETDEESTSQSDED